MLSNNDFIEMSLMTHLFFMRIMKEHTIFLEASLTPKDVDLAIQADNAKEQFTDLLMEAIALSKGVIQPKGDYTCGIVTNYTVNAEMATQFLTSIPIDTNLTTAELSLRDIPPIKKPYPHYLICRVYELNQKAIQATQSIIDFKAQLERNVLECRVFTHLYPTLLHHVFEEAKFYLNLLIMLHNRLDKECIYNIVYQEIFWNHIMGEHAEFIRGFLDPEEKELFHTADEFAERFEKLVELAEKAANDPELIPSVTKESLENTVELRDFKKDSTEGILSCKIKSIIIPLLSDHVLREANYYIHILSMHDE